MGMLSEVLDILKGLSANKEYISQYLVNPKPRQKSLSRSSLDGTLNFPILASSLLSVEDASLIAKSLERNFSSFVLTTITMNPCFDVNRSPSGIDYIKQIHQNIDAPTDVDIGRDVVSPIVTLAGMSEYVNYLEDNCIDYSMCVESYNGNVLIAVEHLNATYSPVNQHNKKYNYTIDEVTNPAIINHRTKYVTEAKGDKSRGGVTNKYVDNEYKKVNELVPTLIQVRVYPTAKNSDKKYAPIDMVIGIKGTLHPIPSNEMLLNLSRGLVNDDTFFNFLRWTTGEISFFKDFLLAMDTLKMDASNDSNKVSPWWSMLKRRKALARIKGNILPNKILPNATIVITEEEVTLLKEKYGYDLNNRDYIFKLMKAYFLIAFVIVDPSLQRARFLFDGRYEFETYTYATLKKEQSGDDQKFKEMINLLGRRM